MSKSLSQNMPSFVKSVSENSSPINNVIVDDSSTNTTSTTEVKKIVLLKRNPNNNNNATNNNNSPTNNTLGSSNVVQSYELLPTPNRSGTSSPSLESELTPEQAAHLGEIDFNTGLDGFLLAALKNQKDRLFLLKLDQEMERFIKEKNRTRLEFPPMNSYQRLIVHRVAQYFKLSHVVDTSGKAVVLYKSAETQIPILRFSDLLEQEEEKPEKSVKIMRRQQTHPQGQLRSTGDSDSNSEGERKILTIEEREAAYQKARARIFKDLEQKNGENEQEDTEGSMNSSPSVKNSSITTTNDAQNSDSSPSNKPKGNQQQNNKNGNNNKNGKQSQQGNRTVGNNKNSNNKNNGNSAKNRQQQPARVQPFPYNPPMFMKQGRPIPNFPGPPQMMHSGHFSPFFGAPMNMYDVNMLHMQPILPPDMQPHMSNHYMPDWNALGPPYGRPGVRNVWGSESFNGPPQEINGGSSLFNHQQNNPNSFLPPRPAASQNDTNFVQNQAQNNLKHMYPQNPYAQPVSEANHIVASSVSSGDGNSNKSSSTREGTTSLISPHSGFDGDNSIWTNKLHRGITPGNEGINENKMNDRQPEQKRTNRTSFNPQSQQRDVPLFNSVWNNPPDSQVFNQSQTSNEFSVQNVPGMPIIPPHMYPGMIPSPMSGQLSGPRRNNNGNQIFPGPIPQEYVNMQRMVPPPIMGFAPQPTQPNMTSTGAIRPPKSSELFDPNNPNNPNNLNNLPTSTTAPYNKAPVASLPANNATQVSPVPPTYVSSLPSRPTQPAMSSKVVSPSGNNNSSSMPWSGGSTTRTKVTTLPPNHNNSNNRRKNTNDNNNNNASNNSVVDGTMMRSLSLSSNSSQQNRNHHNNHNNHNNHHHHHNRASSTSPSGNNNNSNKKNNKDGSLLFDYSMQVPYEGVKPSEANEPQKPNHILELYDFAESDDLMDIVLLNATIKCVSPSNNSPNKKPTILAIFRNAREASKAVQSFRGVRFKIKTWEPLVKTSNGSPPTSSGQAPASTINLSPTSNISTNNKTNIEGNYEKHHQQSLMNVSHGVTLSGRQQ